MVEHAPSSPYTQPSPKPTTIDLIGLRVLVIDDDPDSTGLVSRMLTRYRAVVETAFSVESALERLDSFHPQIVISDIGMPVRDGFDLIATIRGLPAAAGGETPAVALTAYTGPEDRARIMRAGFQAHLAKPVQMDELVAVVARLAHRPGSP